jgi:hypothetical protein
LEDEKIPIEKFDRNKQLIEVSTAHLKEEIRKAKIEKKVK